MASADIHHIGDAAIGGMDAENLMHYSEVIRENVIQSYVWLDLSIDKTKYIKGLRPQSFKPFVCYSFTLY